jgi:HK97 gp10 family phage protein
MIISQRQGETTTTIKNGTTITFISYKKQIQEKLTSALERGMVKSCQIVERDAKKNTLHPAPSMIVHPERVDTGRLAASVTYLVDKDSRGNIQGRVGTNVVHGKYLELGTKYMHYPWLFPALEANRERIKELLGKCYIGNVND